MKFYSRLNVYKASNVSFNPDTIAAYSYGWWKFVSVINGKVIFNNYNYSPSTNKHQHKVRRLMAELGIDIDLMVNTCEDLNGKARYGQSISQKDYSKLCVNNMYREYFQLQIKLARQRKGLEYTHDRMARLLKDISKAETIFKVHLSKKLVKEIKAHQVELDEQKRKSARDRRATKVEMNRQREVKTPHLSLVGGAI